MDKDNRGMDATLHEQKQAKARRGRPLRDYETLDLFTGEPSRKPPRPFKPTKQAERVLELVLSKEWVWEVGIASTPPEGVPAGNVRNILAALARAGFIERRLPPAHFTGSANIQIYPTEKARMWLREQREQAQPEKKPEAPDTETLDVLPGYDWMLPRIRLIAKREDMLCVSVFFASLLREPKDKAEIEAAGSFLREAASRGWVRKIPGEVGSYKGRGWPVYKSLIREGR